MQYPLAMKKFSMVMQVLPGELTQYLSFVLLIHICALSNSLWQ